MPGMDGGPTTGLLKGVDAEHLPALVALLLLPVALWLALTLARRLARSGHVRIQRWLLAYDASPLLTRVTALFLVAAGVIHLALIPGHAQAEPGTAWLFVINGILFVGIALPAFVWRHWRGPAAALLALTTLFYAGYVVAGRETADQVGVATLLLELAALGFTLMAAEPNGRVRSSWTRLTIAGGAVLLMTVFTGSLVWAASMRPQPDGVEAGMLMQAVPSKPPTPAQQEAAARLVAETRAGIAKYQNIEVALADGYRASTAPNAPTVHYENPAYAHDGLILDPDRPEDLVYANTSHGPVLLGAMYMMPKAGEPGPDIGGSLTRWHVHENLCFALGPVRIAGLLTPFGTCPAGTLNAPTPAMMHVWTAPNPNGPLGELDNAWVKQLVRQ